MRDANVARAAAAVERGAACFTWGFLQALATDPEVLSGSTREAIAEAIADLEKVLGPAWLHESIGRCPLAALGAWPLGSSLRQLRQLVLLGTQFRRLRESPGFDGIIRECGWELAKWRHLALQLEVATLAAHRDHGVRFADPNSSGYSDVTITTADTQIVVETTVTALDFETRKSSEAQDRLTYTMRPELDRLRTGCAVSVEAVLGASDVQMVSDFLRTCETAPIGRVVIGPVAMDFSAGALSVSGPTLTGDEWLRMAKRLSDKGRQSRGASVWVRYDHDGFLFVMNTFSDLTIAERLQSLQGNLEAMTGLAGVVLSSGGPVENDRKDVLIVGEEGAAALTCVHPYGSREVYVIPLTRAALADVPVWIDMYENEAQALDHLLDGTGLESTA